MRPNIVNLRQFYASPLGRKACRRLRGVTGLGAAAGLHQVGAGYTTGLLPLPQQPEHKNSRIIALMPAEQGAIYWPVDEANHSVLGDVLRPPFLPSSLHRVLMVHSVEHEPAPEEMLRIWWQLLVPGGRLTVVVPNRWGLWSRVGATPFASGSRYTLPALRSLLNAAGFTVRDARTALFAPPSAHPVVLRLFVALEWLGAFFVPRLGGVWVVEAEKQIYAGIREPLTAIKTARAWATKSPALASPRSR